MEQDTDGLQTISRFKKEVQVCDEGAGGHRSCVLTVSGAPTTHTPPRPRPLISHRRLCRPNITALPCVIKGLSCHKQRT